MKKKLLSPLLIAFLGTQVNAAEPVVVNDATKENITSTVAAPPPAHEPSMDCNYHIPATQTAIDAAMITAWAEKAAMQSFTFAPTTIQNQLEMLKACYTEQGWKGFNDALQKSGNIDSIKNQQLNVSAQVDGTPNINTVKDGQWKVTLPMQIVYQNDKEKVTQRLSVSILIGRQPSGDLGIMQLVATAKPDETPAADKTASTPSPTPAEQAPANKASQASPNTNDTPVGPGGTPSQPAQTTTPNPAP